jgi:hypothetical protein
MIDYGARAIILSKVKQLLLLLLAANEQENNLTAGCNYAFIPRRAQKSHPLARPPSASAGIDNLHSFFCSLQSLSHSLTLAPHV